MEAIERATELHQRQRITRFPENHRPNIRSMENPWQYQRPPLNTREYPLPPFIGYAPPPPMGYPPPPPPPMGYAPRPAIQCPPPPTMGYAPRPAIQCPPPPAMECPPPPATSQYPFPGSGSTVSLPNYFGSVDFGADYGGLAAPYMAKFWFEDRKHVPDDEFYAPGDEEEERKPNTHQLVKRFLKKVRESKGYDVDCMPPKIFGSPFMPVDLVAAQEFAGGLYFPARVLKPAHFAIQKINALTGRNYELVEILKAVDTPCRLVYLTLAARDCVANANAPVETFQALVSVPYGKKPICKLIEWRLKPVPGASSGA